MQFLTPANSILTVPVDVDKDGYIISSGTAAGKKNVTLKYFKTIDNGNLNTYENAQTACRLLSEIFQTVITFSEMKQTISRKVGE